MDDIFLLRDYIYDTTGIYFPDSKRYFFEDRIAQRLKNLKLDSSKSYFQYLRNHPASRKELNRLIQEITINETYFYRNVAQFKVMNDVIIPEIIHYKTHSNDKNSPTERELRIWSAGCSSGEEVYTIALFLHHNMRRIIDNWQIEIVGTDINQNMIQKAKQGIYSSYTLRNVPQEVREKYFKRVQQGFEISDEIKKMARFEASNLNDYFTMAIMKRFDVIFCRNVLIYFNNQSKKKVIEHFYNNLQTLGFLFLGHSESLFDITDKFKLVHFPGGMAYKKKS